MSKDGFHCACCGKWHDGLPMSWNFLAPVYWDPNDKHSIKTGASELSDDLCVIKREHFFIKGNLEIKVVDRNSTFSLSVWTSLSRENFERAGAMWKNAERVKEPSYFGWFSSSVPGYPETLGLRTNVHTRSVGTRPYVELEATEHPLAIEQRDGITVERVAEIAALMMHANTK